MSFLQQHRIGLPLDFAPSYLCSDGGCGDLAGGVPASVVNDICGLHRYRVASLGHDVVGLWCFLYELSYPMVENGENLLEEWRRARQGWPV